MKKAFTFIMAAMLGIVVTASAQVNDVVLTNNSNYEVDIDGRAYNANNTYTISDLSAGNHLVSVYQVSSRGIFSRKTRSLISSKQFTSGNGRVSIAVNQSGQISLNRNGSGNNDGTWNDKGDKKYGKSEGKGNGNKYGHYKNKKNKNKKSDKNDNDDNDDNEDVRYDKQKKSNRGNGKS